MIKLFKLELAKIINTRYFKVLTLLWLIAFFSIPIAYNSLVDMLTENTFNSNSELLNPALWPFFDFADIWQNMTYVYKMITIFMCLILIISTTNEFDYKTARQNIINGLSKKKFWLSKFSLILITASIATLMLLVLILITGFLYSPITDLDFILQNISFLGAYFLHLIHFLLFTLLISLLIKRAGFSIAIVLFWTYIIEPILATITKHYFGFAGDLYPMESGWNLIRLPFTKYALMETQTFVGIIDVGIAFIWILIFVFLSYRLLTRRDI